MSKKNRNRTKTRSSAPSTSASVAAAMRAANQRGSYGASIAAKEIARAFGEATLKLHRQKPKARLSKVEKAARKRVKAAQRGSSMARAARLPRRSKKRSRVAPQQRTSKRSTSRTACAPKKRMSKKKLPTVTANQVLQAAAKRWLCENVTRRTGCGGKGSRVVKGQGSFTRIRPPRFMTSG